MNEVATVDEGTAMAVPAGSNPFEQFGKSAESTIKGDILKFSKGDWTYGQNDTDVPAKYKFVAHCHTTTIGWQKWEDKKPVDSRMGMIADGFVPPKRSELGDHDEAEWEVDKEGKPQDPWQQTTMMYLTNHDGSSEFTFTSGSVGGRQFSAKLCGEYGKRLRTHDASKGNLCPVIYVGSDSYKHDDYGKIFKPTFEILEWITVSYDEGENPAAPQITDGGEPVDDEVPY